jgi:protein TonB
VLNPSPRADNRPPRYPAESLERGERGAVVLRIRVSEAGQVVEVLVERSSGYPLLDAAAVEAAYAWRYAPARMDGAPVSALVRQTVRFERQA